MTRFAALLCSLMLALASAQAQEDYRFDIGGGLGMTGYLGDANDGNLWQHPGWDLQVLWRYKPNTRLAFKTSFYTGQLNGDSADVDNVLPPEVQPFKFSTTFYELSELFEFNFLSYGMGETYRKLSRWSPYICAGLGVTAWNSDGFGAALTLPFGAGIKYKPARRWNIGLEFLMKKTFTDRLDSRPLSDPYAIRSSLMKNTDWYSTLTLSVSYEFSKRCAVCNYKD